MGNIDSSNKSEKNLRKSSNSSNISDIKKPASERIISRIYTSQDKIKNYNFEDLKKNKNKSIIDLISTKIDRSKVINEIVSLKILQISSKFLESLFLRSAFPLCAPDMAWPSRLPGRPCWA